MDLVKTIALVETEFPGWNWQITSIIPGERYDAHLWSLEARRDAPGVRVFGESPVAALDAALSRARAGQFTKGHALVPRLRHNAFGKNSMGYFRDGSFEDHVLDDLKDRARIHEKTHIETVTAICKIVPLLLEEAPGELSAENEDIRRLAESVYRAWTRGEVSAASMSALGRALGLAPKEESHV